ncbi:MAG: response regulator transcription factor [Treponema sp.]|jgi:two-component system alkaline phosphatase synthesis response regulator PhoP|nr:response regulator transcription factor [Treponema sp.]
MSRKILIVEDEEGLRITMGDRLASEGYHVIEAKTGTQGIELGRNETIDLIILDIMLPEVDGFTVCKKLREDGVLTPIIMLSAKSLLEDKVTGLKTGADDYMTKPFEMSELLARIEVQIRRGEAIKAVHSKHDDDKPSDLVINLRRGYMEVQGKEVPLLAQEIKLLDYMFLHEGEVISRDRLLDEVWGYEEKVSTRTIDVHVARLRQKMNDAKGVPRYIQTVRGIGYKFTSPKSDSFK